MKITNHSRAAQGVYATSGLVFVRPGQSREVDLTEDGLKFANRLPFLTIDAKLAEPAAPGSGASDQDEPLSERDELKKQAAELGLDFPRNISTEKLKALIDAKLAE